MLARSILTSLGLLKFRHKELLNSICALMSEKLDKTEGAGSECASMLMPKDKTAFLMTTATLNYIPVNSEKLYQVNSDMHTTSHLCTFSASKLDLAHIHGIKFSNILGCD